MWQNWIVGDEPENCVPMGEDTEAGAGKIVRARSAEEACKKGIKEFNKITNPKSILAKL